MNKISQILIFIAIFLLGLSLLIEINSVKGEENCKEKLREKLREKGLPTPLEANCEKLKEILKSKS